MLLIHQTVLASLFFLGKTLEALINEPALSQVQLAIRRVARIGRAIEIFRSVTGFVLLIDSERLEGSCSLRCSSQRDS